VLADGREAAGEDLRDAPLVAARGVQHRRARRDSRFDGGDILNSAAELGERLDRGEALDDQLPGQRPDGVVVNSSGAEAAQAGTARCRKHDIARIMLFEDWAAIYPEARISEPDQPDAF